MVEVGNTQQEHPENPTVEYVKQLSNPTDRFLCKLSDNWAVFRFRGFKIRDMVSNITLVEVPDDEEELNVDNYQ